MVYSREQLEQSLGAYGDTLFRVALVIAGDEGRAARLLRDLAASLAPRAGAPEAETGPLDEPALLARMVAVARAAEARAQSGPALRPPQRQRANPFAPFAVHHLALDQRIALGLHALLGYDGPRLAAALGVGQAAARAALEGAVRALGPAAGSALTDRVSGDQCEGVRAVLVDPAAGSRHGAAVRGHLAGCSLCRAYDHAWGQILAAVEEALRRALRPRVMPEALRARMVALAAPRAARRAPSWRAARVALAPLAVLALIAALALPGFLRQPVRVVEREPGPPVDAQALIARALERHTTPPDKGGIWHGRFETLWYFNDDLYAPLRADAWLDPRNAARHRLQLAHRDGGAPYELQVGDGVGRLAYALDVAYAPSLYGGLPTPARMDEPALVAQPLDTAGQTRARDERLAAGPWSLPPAYLRQAQAASDLRLLGRQIDDGRLVQILSFSGVSPLGLPPDAPGATAERITVLLALDSEDGLLRSATELTGPPGGAQVGRITWRVVEEQWVSGPEQISAIFAPERAWTGIGSFDDSPRAASADVAMPLVGARDVGDPAELLTLWRVPFWLPARTPAGVDRALLLWTARDRQRGNPPSGLIYLGTGRRLVLAFNRAQVVSGEPLAVGPWRVSLRAGRGQRYTASAVRAEVAPELKSIGMFDASATILLDAYGFTRAELEAVVESMAPFDLGALLSQDSLFLRPGAGDPAPRAALLEAVADLARPPAESAWHITGRSYIRQDPAAHDTRRDPYHLPYYEGRPEETMVDAWLAGGGPAPSLYVETRGPRGGEALVTSYAGPEGGWRYLPAGDALTELPGELLPATMRLPALGAVAVEMLGTPGALALERLPGGGGVVRHSEPSITSRRFAASVANPSMSEPHLFDLHPITMTTELELSPVGEAVTARVYAESVDGGRVTRTLVQSYELVAREAVPLDEAPARLSGSAAPEAAFVSPFYKASFPQAPILQREKLSQALVWPDVPLYVLAEEEARLVSVEEGALAQPGASQLIGGVTDVLREAVVRRLALCLTYWTPPGEYGPDSFDVKITQGPAGPLRTFLRGTPMVPWWTSEPIELTVAGQEVEGWYGQGDRAYLFVELGPTLLVIDSPRPPDDPALRALLAGLRPAR